MRENKLVNEMVYCVYCDRQVICEWSEHTATEEHINNIRNFLRTQDTIDVPEVVVIGSRNYAFFWIWTILILIVGIAIGVIVE